MLEVAKAAIDGLKVSPSCLAVVVLSGGMAILTFMALKEQRALNHEELIMALRACPSTYDYNQRRSE